MADPIQKQSSTSPLSINSAYLKWIFNGWFPLQMNKCVQLLVTMLEDLAKKSLIWVKISELQEILVVT